VIENLKQPLYSITAKKSMTGLDEFSRYTDEDFDTDLPPIPENELFESGWELQDIEGLDLILDSGEERDKVFSTILDLTDEEIKVLRYGAGAWPV